MNDETLPPRLDLVDVVATYQCPVCFALVTITNDFAADREDPRHTDCPGPDTPEG